VAYSEHICTASFKGVAFLQSHAVTHTVEKRKATKKVNVPFFLCSVFWWLDYIQVMWWDSEDAPRVTHGQQAVIRSFFSFSLSLFLIGIDWNVRCLVNVLNPFKQKKERTSIKWPCYLLLDCLWSKSVQFVISTSRHGMSRSSCGWYRCLLLVCFFPFPHNTNADFIIILLLLHKSYIFPLRQILTEIRSPFLKFCPMVLSIEEIKMKLMVLVFSCLPF